MKWRQVTSRNSAIKFCAACMVFAIANSSVVQAAQAAGQTAVQPVSTNAIQSDQLYLNIPTSLAAPFDTQTLIACATCGCSELCSVSLIDENLHGKGGSTVTDSIWGNIILKIAYDRDPELQKYRKKLRLGNNVTSASLFGIAGGTLAQTISSTATLNPPEGMTDSYAPGIIGLSLDVAANVTFGSRGLLNYKLRKQMRARQINVKNQVDKILVHLENSETKCPEAQADLSKIIGDRAAAECIQLWQSSHELAQSEPLKVTQAEISEDSKPR